jgi:chromosome segregation ATPase
MDKTKANFIITIVVLVIISLVLMGYIANLNAQLNNEKIKTLQLNDRIAGLNAKANDIQVQLASATNKASDQTNLVNSLQASVNNLQSSLDTANAELEKVKKAYEDLESKLKAQVPTNTLPNIPQPVVK